jgi:hypothetical protein
MRQTLHILAKDVRRQRIDIALLVAILVLFSSAATSESTRRAVDSAVLDILIFAACALVVARVVQAEPIPGDRQFWITRPYRWKALLAAKLLFIVLVVHVPIAIAQMVIVHAAALPLLPALPGLLWCQILLGLVVSLPAAILAAVTAGLVPFLFIALVFTAFEWVVYAQTQVPGSNWLYAVEWFRDALPLALFSLLAATILYIQYRHRRTLLSRVIGVVTVLVCAALFSFVPWSYAYAVQTRLSKHAFDSSLIQIGLQTEPFASYSMSQQGRVTIELPLRITGVPAGSELVVDAVTVSLVDAGGETWRSEIPDVRPLRQKADSGESFFRITLFVDEAFFNKHKRDAITARGSFYMTTFGNTKSETIRVQQQPVNITDGLQCFAAPRMYSRIQLATDLVCRSAFRWPSRLVDALTPNTNVAASFGREVSYSPFPATLALNPLDYRWTAISLADTVTLSVSEPLSHFRRDFEIGGIRLSEFTGQR